MVTFSSGLIVTPTLRAAQVSSVEMTFEPSIGIMARKYDKLGASIKSFRVPLKRAVQEVVIPSIQVNFHKSGRPRWPDLAESTWRQKGSGEKALIRTGALMRRMAQVGIWQIDTEKAMITHMPEDVWYGALHQAGHGTYEGFFDPVKRATVNIGGEGALPARPFVMLQSEDLPKIDLIFVEWVNERVQRAGL